MKIKLFGSGLHEQYYAAQAPRIMEGLIELGHDIVDKESDLIYANDPGWFLQAIEHKEKYGGFLILNILDCPAHVPEFPEWIEKNKRLLAHADAITSISETTQTNVKKYLGYESKVIYNPIKNITYQNKEKRTQLFMMAGRLLDINKRSFLIKEICNNISINNNFECLHIYGSEDIGVGEYHGIVNDEELNFAYNNTLFSFILSKNEGINLVLIESLIAGCIPIVCEDMSTAKEFAPPEFLCKPDSLSIYNKFIEIFNNYKIYKQICIEYGNKYKIMFDKQTIAKNILNLI